MKLSYLHFGFLAVAVLLLSACEITVTPVPGGPPGFEVSNSSYTTDYQADLNADGNFDSVICDDRTTNLTYQFAFTGSLDTWESYLAGEKGEIAGRQTLTLGSRFVNYNPDTKTVKVNYEIRPSSAPRVVAPQGIVPTPKVDRYVRLYLKIDGYTKAYDLSSKQIPVLAACG